MMTNYYWNGWYAGWGWFLWLGMIIVIFSSFGNWRYTYQVHKRYRDGLMSKDASEILNERYATGEISREEFNEMKSDIAKNRSASKNHGEPVKDIRFNYQNDKKNRNNERFRS